MTHNLTRRHFLAGTAATATLLALPRGAMAEGLNYKGELAMVGLVRTPPDEAWAARSKAFGAANPGITIKQTDYPSENYVSLFTAQQTAGQPNDILFLNGQDLRRYATNGTLAALDDSGIELTRFRPGAITTGQINKKTYGLPVGSISGFPIFVNRKVLAKAGADIPTSYADLLALRDKLKAEGLKVFTHPGKNIYLWPVWFFTTFAQTSGNKSVERTAEILGGTGKFTDDDVVKALDLLAQFGKDGLITQDSFSQDTPQTLADFSAGRAAFWMQHESLISQLASSKPEGVELDVMLMPKLVDGDVKSQYPGGPSGIVGVNAKSEGDRGAAARAFIDWMTTDEANREEVKFNNGTVPVNAGVEPFGGGVVEKMVDFSSNLVTYLDWNWPPEVTRAFQEGIQGCVAGQLSAADAAQGAQEALDQLVANGYKFLQ